MNHFFIYAHYKEDPIANPMALPYYIGKGHGDRASYVKGRGKHHARVVKKYGFHWAYLAENLTYEQANATEVFYILKYGRLDLKTGCLINLTNGGDGCIGFSDATKAKIAKSVSEYMNSDRANEQKERARIACRTPEHREKRRIIGIEIASKQTPEFKANVIKKRNITLANTAPEIKQERNARRATSVALSWTPERHKQNNLYFAQTETKERCKFHCNKNLHTAEQKEKLIERNKSQKNIERARRDVRKSILNPQAIAKRNASNRTDARRNAVSEQFKKLYEKPESNPAYKGKILATNVSNPSITIILNGVKEMKTHDFSPPKVYCCVNGSRSTHKGFTFERI